MWGPGAYFSTRADYSVGYSYTLKSKDCDKPQHAGQKVFLCCQVATGKAYDCQPNGNLKRPPQIPGMQTDYDSVTGITENTKVYILYQMDIRRAYPAYEVIYR